MGGKLVTTQIPAILRPCQCNYSDFHLLSHHSIAGQPLFPENHLASQCLWVTDLMGATAYILRHCEVMANVLIHIEAFNAGESNVSEFWSLKIAIRLGH